MSTARRAAAVVLPVVLALAATAGVALQRHGSDHFDHVVLTPADESRVAVGPVTVGRLDGRLALLGVDADTMHYVDRDHPSSAATFGAKGTSPDPPAMTIRATAVDAATASASLLAFRLQEGSERRTVDGAPAVLIRVDEHWSSLVQYRSGALVEVAATGLPVDELVRVMRTVR